MTGRKCPPRSQEKLVQSIGPEVFRTARRRPRVTMDTDRAAPHAHPARKARAHPRGRAGSLLDARFPRRHDRPDRRSGRHVEAQPALLFPPQGRHPRHADAAPARHLAGAAARARRHRRPDDRAPQLHPPQARDGARLSAREPAVRQRDPAGRAAHHADARRRVEGRWSTRRPRSSRAGCAPARSPAPTPGT